MKAAIRTEGTANGISYNLEQVKGGASWYLRWTDSRNRQQLRKSTKCQTLSNAHAFAAEFFQNYVMGQPTGKVTVADLVLSVLKFKRNHQPRDYSEKLRNWTLRLRDKFGNWDHRDLTPEVIEDYKTWCAGAELDSAASPLLRSWKPIAQTVVVNDDGIRIELKPIAPATVNLDLALLSKAYNDGLRKRVIAIKPYIAKYTERDLKKSVRQGFLIQAEFDRIIALPLPLWLKAMITVAYTCGNRSTELKNLQVGQINFFARTIRLYAGETKNGDGRLVGMTEDMYQLLKAACWNKTAEDYVFTRDDLGQGGRQIGDFRKLWASVLRQAGISRPVRLHDFRRSFCRNGLNRGMTEQEVMDQGGWKTPAMLRRYNVRREGELVAAMNKMELGARLEREAVAAQQAAEERLMKSVKEEQEVVQ